MAVEVKDQNIPIPSVEDTANELMNGEANGPEPSQGMVDTWIDMVSHMNMGDLGFSHSNEIAQRKPVQHEGAQLPNRPEAPTISDEYLYSSGKLSEKVNPLKIQNVIPDGVESGTITLDDSHNYNGNLIPVGVPIPIVKKGDTFVFAGKYTGKGRTDLRVRIGQGDRIELDSPIENSIAKDDFRQLQIPNSQIKSSKITSRIDRGLHEIPNSFLNENGTLNAESASRQIQDIIPNGVEHATVTFKKGRMYNGRDIPANIPIPVRREGDTFVFANDFEGYGLEDGRVRIGEGDRIKLSTAPVTRAEHHPSTTSFTKIAYAIATQDREGVDAINTRMAALNIKLQKMEPGGVLSADDRTFMKNVYRTLEFGGYAKEAVSTIESAVSGVASFLGFETGTDNSHRQKFSSASQLIAHYAEGSGEAIEIDSGIYENSTVVQRAMRDMTAHLQDMVSRGEFREGQSVQIKSRGILGNNFNRETLGEEGAYVDNGVLYAEQKNKALKNTDNRFILHANATNQDGNLEVTWSVNEVYDFQNNPDHITNIRIPGERGLKLYIPDSLSHNLAKHGAAKEFAHRSEWKSTTEIKV